MPERKGREGFNHDQQPCRNDIPRLRLGLTLICLASSKINCVESLSGTYLDKLRFGPLEKAWTSGAVCV